MTGNAVGQRFEAHRVIDVAPLIEDIWYEVDCCCRDDGPWMIYGPVDLGSFCARCGRRMSMSYVNG